MGRHSQDPVPLSPCKALTLPPVSGRRLGSILQLFPSPLGIFLVTNPVKP